MTMDGLGYFHSNKLDIGKTNYKLNCKDKECLILEQEKIE